MTSLSLALKVPAELAADAPPIRVLGTDEHPAFVLPDVCAVLGIRNARDLANEYGEGDVGKADVIDARGRRQKTWVLTERGLYKVVIRSNKPNAEAFTNWICGEVLPTIRKYGCYPAPADGRTPATQFDAALAPLREELSQMRQQIAQLAAKKPDPEREKVETEPAGRRATITQRLRYHHKWWPIPSKIRDKIRKMANELCMTNAKGPDDHSPDKQGGENLYVGAQVAYLDACIDTVRQEIKDKERNEPPNLFNGGAGPRPRD